MNVEELKAEIKLQIEQKTSDLTAKTDAEKQALQKEIDTLKETLKGIQEAPKDITKEEVIAMMNAEFKQFEESLKEIEKKAKKGKNMLDEFTETYKQAVGDDVFKKLENTNQSKEMINAKLTGKLEFKAFDPQAVHSVDSVINDRFLTPGTTGVNSTYRTIMAQVLGTFTKPRPITKILDLVDFMPLVADTLICFEWDYYGGFEITPECEIKPWIYSNIEHQTSEVAQVNALWCTTLKMRVFYAQLLNTFRNKYEELLSEKLARLVLENVVADAVPYTPVPELAVHTAPNYFDSVVAVCASQKKLGFMPNTIVMSPIAYANMLTLKGNDDHYSLSNGNSIVLVEDTIKIGTMNLTIVEDPDLGADDFIIGDFSLFKVGLLPSVIYIETDGRTDEETKMTTGLQLNVRTHELATFFATMLPNALKTGIVKDTFDNVKSLITQ